MLLAGLATLGPFSIDTYLPSFPSIETSLHASAWQLQQTLSVYLLGFAIMMLFHGSLSDAYGRRPVILTSLITFALPRCSKNTTDGLPTVQNVKNSAPNGRFAPAPRGGQETRERPFVCS